MLRRTPSVVSFAKSVRANTQRTIQHVHNNATVRVLVPRPPPGEPLYIRVIRTLCLIAIIAVTLLFTISNIQRYLEAPYSYDLLYNVGPLDPPRILITGPKAVFANATARAYGLLVSPQGVEYQSDVDIGTIFTPSSDYVFFNALPDAVRRAINTSIKFDLFQPDGRWKLRAMGINYSPEAMLDTVKHNSQPYYFVAVRVVLSIPQAIKASVPSAQMPALEIRLAPPDLTVQDLQNRNIAPITTILPGMAREIQFTQFTEVNTFDLSQTFYTVNTLDYPLSSVNVTGADYVFQIRSVNPITSQGEYIALTRIPNQVMTWFDVISAVGGVLGLLFFIYTALFGASRLRTWGLTHWFWRKKIAKNAKDRWEVQRVPTSQGYSEFQGTQLHRSKTEKTDESLEVPSSPTSPSLDVPRIIVPQNDNQEDWMRGRLDALEDRILRAEVFQRILKDYFVEDDLFDSVLDDTLPTAYTQPKKRWYMPWK